MKKERINITLDKDVMERLKSESKKDDRSNSSFINKVLRKLFKLENEGTTPKGSK